MVQKIALFNPRGGVGKTTTALNLGWMLAIKGKRVVIVDADPQCNLTEILLERNIEENEAETQSIYNIASNIKTGLAPAFEASPKAISAVNCIPIQSRDGLFLLPGSLELAEYEVPLGVAQELSGSVPSLRNIPGAITDLLNKTAEELDADYILIDMSPSLGSINQNLLMTSDFFIVPTIANLSSAMTINSLAKVLPKWYAWAKKASSLQSLKGSIYPFPEVNLRFLGTIIQTHESVRGRQIHSTQSMIQMLEKSISVDLFPILQQSGMILPEHLYKRQGIGDGFLLAEVPNVATLISLSWLHRTSIYDLTPQMFGQRGVVLETYQRKQEEFRQTFSNLADKIIALSSESSAYAVSA